MTRLRMTAAGFLSLPEPYRLGAPHDDPRALTLNPEGGGTELWPVEIADERWHRLYVEVDMRAVVPNPSYGAMWEIQRLDGGGEYRILHNLSEVGARTWRWDSIRAQFCGRAWPMCPDLDEPQVAVRELSYVVTHGGQSCEVGKGVVSDEWAALSYAAALFEMNRKDRSDDWFHRRLNGGTATLRLRFGEGCE